MVEEAAPAETAPVRPGVGPWDSTEAPEDGVARIDFGAMQVPTLPDVEVRVEAAQTGEVTAVLLLNGGSGLQLGVFAAPRSEGIWAEIRTEIGESIVTEGGSTLEVDGEFGTELHAQVPTPDGKQTVRFVGIEGPRWLVRAVFTGSAAVDPSADEVLTQSLRDIVVVRGSEPMPVRDALPLRLPREAVEEPVDTNTKPQLSQLERGPEITEIG